MATDSKHKSDGKWFIGVSQEKPDRIKKDLSLDSCSGHVDLVVQSHQSKEIFSRVCESLNHTHVTNQWIQVEGDHDRLAQLITQITRDYEDNHPSFRRTMARLFLSVNP